MFQKAHISTNTSVTSTTALPQSASTPKIGSHRGTKVQQQKDAASPIPKGGKTFKLDSMVQRLTGSTIQQLKSGKKTRDYWADLSKTIANGLSKKYKEIVGENTASANKSDKAAGRIAVYSELVSISKLSKSAGKAKISDRVALRLDPEIKPDGLAGARKTLAKDVHKMVKNGVKDKNSMDLLYATLLNTELENPTAAKIIKGAIIDAFSNLDNTQKNQNFIKEQAARIKEFDPNLAIKIEANFSSKNLDTSFIINALKDNDLGKGKAILTQVQNNLSPKAYEKFELKLQGDILYHISDPDADQKLGLKNAITLGD